MPATGTTAPQSTPEPAPASREWHYRPTLPIQVSPLFAWPPDPLRIVKWFWNAWFLISERLILVGVAFASWLYLQPSLERCREFAVGCTGRRSTGLPTACITATPMWAPGQAFPCTRSRTSFI